MSGYCWCNLYLKSIRKISFEWPIYIWFLHVLYFSFFDWVSQCRLDKLLSPSVLTYMRVPYVPRSQGNSNGRRKPDLPPSPGHKRYKSPNVGMHGSGKRGLQLAKSRLPRPTPPTPPLTTPVTHLSVPPADPDPALLASIIAALLVVMWQGGQ
jgi:hypothetical protein